MSARKLKLKLLLTQRALCDIAEIEEYSVQQWGKKIAEKYLSDLEAGLLRIQENPELLLSRADYCSTTAPDCAAQQALCVEHDLHPELRFYRVNKHILVCDMQPNAIFLLTVIHASRDIPSRLAEMQPNLVAEIELLRQQLDGKKR